MLVVRDERNVLRIADDGSLVIPAGCLKQILTDGNDTPAGLAEDLADFGPGRLVFLELMDGDNGTSVNINRDRRTEVGKP